MERVNTITGQSDAHGLRLAIVASRFNELVVKALVEGAHDTLLRLGADEDAITLVWVPGGIELPLAARALADSGEIDAIICLGAVIRGETAHFEHVAGSAARGIAEVALTTGIPVSFGVLTVDSLEQAQQRAGGKLGNRGADAAATAVEMANLLRRVRRPRAVIHGRESRAGE